MSWLGATNRSISNPALNVTAALGGADATFTPGTLTASTGGATLIFSYANFSDSPSTIHLSNTDRSAFSGSVIDMISTAPAHAVGAAWYYLQQPPTAFTTQFSFTPVGLSTGSAPNQSGLTFCIQNTNATTNPDGYGLNYGGDANCDGYSGAIGQYPPPDSIAIKLDAGSGNAGIVYPNGGVPNTTGMYFNGAPVLQNGGSIGLFPANDMNPYGIDLYTNDTFNVTIVYDGSLLTMVIQDTTTLAQARYVWPLNLANTTNATGNWVGFTAGTATLGDFYINSWSYWSGYNTRLATPTFSPAPSEYAGTQTVTISYPAGSTCYYTTNGLLPTSASTQYTGPISVAANEVIQAVAIESGYTDSLVGTGAFQIGTSNVINLPSGFSTNDGVIPVAYAYKSGSQLILTDTLSSPTYAGVAGAGWFANPVNIQSGWNTTFQLNWTGDSSSYGGGMGICFVIQNNPQPYASLSNATNQSGGPTVFGQPDIGMGYGGIGTSPQQGILNSVAIAFDLSTVPNSVGLYTNGATPQGNQTATSLTFGGGVFNVTLSYSGTTLSISMQSSGGGTTFTHSWTVNIPSVVGANTAYVGFTGGTAGNWFQAINSWTFS